MVQTTVMYMSAGKTGGLTIYSQGRANAHAPWWHRSELGHFHTRLNHNHYITPPRPLVSGSKAYTRCNYGKQKENKNKYKNKRKVRSRGAAAGDVPRTADGEGSGCLLVQPRFAARAGAGLAGLKAQH